MASASFDTTRWSVVLHARDAGSADALAELCRGYWQPLFAFALRRGHACEAAKDLTQGFFVALLEGQFLDAVRQDRGRFRSFLLACFKHYLAHEWRKSQTAKRGAGATHVPLDLEGMIDPPSELLSPEAAYERQWALTLLAGAVNELERRYRSRGREKLFAALKPLLSADESDYDPATVATALGMSPGAVRVAAHRLRRQYRDTLRRHVAETLDEGESVASELGYLMSVL